MYNYNGAVERAQRPVLLADGRRGGDRQAIIIIIIIIMIIVIIHICICIYIYIERERDI